MITALLAAATLAPAASWYGPATATFDVQFAGNPYDPDVNDVRVLFLPVKGAPVERLAYYDGVTCSYKAVLVAKQPGEYRAVLVRNGRQVSESPVEKKIELTDALPHGFVRCDPVRQNRFRWDDGTPYYPIGMNLGWQSPNLPKMPDHLEKMSKSGMTWSRIWSCAWDGKNPWWAQDKEGTEGQLWTPALERWQEIVDRCDKIGLPFQMVLFHHGLFSSTVNPNWPDHPWNAKNGGFLKDAADFFTDKEAKRRSKIWLRYAVARWGSSPSILAWELFNEVEWTDCWKSPRRPEVFAWHKEMADYIRSLDPYRHLVTTSSDMSEKGLYEAMDYVQPHTYPVDIPSSIAAAVPPADKPLFFGEFGPEGMADLRKAVRDGIFAAIAQNHAGTAQYWSWDNVEARNLYDEWTKAAKALELSDFANHPDARPLTLAVRSSTTADLKMAPALGWTASTKTDYDLQPGVKPILSGVSSYLHGKAHPELQPGWPTFRFVATKEGTFRVQLGQVAESGAHVRLLLDGKVVAEQEMPKTRRITILDAKFAPGPHVVAIDNTGADWATLTLLSITGFGPAATTMAVGDSAMTLIRLTAAQGASKPTVQLGGVSFPDGPLQAKVLSLDDGAVTEATLQVRDHAILDYPMPAEDLVLIIR